MISFTVPGEPQGKGRARTGRSGRHYTPAKTVAYEGLIALAGAQAMNGKPPFSGPVSLAFTAGFSIPASASKSKRAAMLNGEILPTKAPDLDNIMKAIGDGLNKVAFNDDSQIVRLGIVQKIYVETPGLFVSVEPINFTAGRPA